MILSQLSVEQEKKAVPRWNCGESYIERVREEKELAKKIRKRSGKKEVIL